MTTTKFPQPIGANLLASLASSLSLFIDMPVQESRVWFEFECDGRAIGFVLFKRVAVLRPGLTTYAASEFRGPGDSPPPQDICRSASQWLCRG